MTPAAARTAVVLFAAPLLLLGACEDTTMPDLGETALLQTDRDEYVLVEDGAPYTTRIPYTFRNTTGRTVFLANCNGYVAPGLQQWDGDEWGPGWSPLENLCLSLPVEIAPGELFEDTLYVFGYGQGGGIYPQFQTPNIEGVYRLSWHRARFDYDAADSSGTPMPEKYRVSNAFRLRVE